VSESRRPRLHRLLRLTLTLLAVGGLTRVALRSDHFRLWLTDLIAHEASDLLGEEVLLGDAIVEVFPARVTLRGLVVRSAETGEPLIVARRVRARVGLGWTGPRLRVLELDRPFVRLNLNDGALADFPGLRDDEEDDDTPSEPMSELPWDELIVRDAELQLAWSTAGEPGGELIVEGVNLRPALVGGLVDLRVDALSVEAGKLKQATTDLRIDNIELAPDRVILPDFGLELPILRVDGRVAFIFGGSLGGHLAVQARAAELSQLLPEGMRVEGDLDADVTLGGTASAPDIDVNLAGRPVLLWGAPGGPESRYDFGELAAAVKVKAEGLRVDPLILRWAGGRVEVEGDMAWDLSVPHASVRAEDLSFAQIMALVGGTPGAWVEFLGDAEITLAGTLSPLLLTGPFEVMGKDLVVAAGPTRLPSSTVLLDIPQARLAGNLDLHADGIHLDARELVAGNTRGEVDAWLGWVGNTPLGLDVNLYAADLSTFAPLGDVNLQGQGLVKGTIEGSYSDPDIFGELDILNFACLGVPWAEQLTSAISTTDLIHVDLTDFAARRRETTSRGNLRLGFEEEMTLETQVLVQDGQLYDLMSMFLDVPQITGRADLTLSLAGPLYGLEGESRVALRDVSLYGERFPEGRAKGAMREGRFTLDHLLLSRDEGAESLFARGSVGAGWAMNMELVADGLRLETLNNLDGDNLIGRLDADIGVGGTLFSPEPRGRITLHDAKAAGGFIADARVDLRTAGEVMSFAGGMLDGTAKVSGRVGLFDGQRWRAAFELYDLPIERYIVLGGYGEPARLSFTGRGEATGALGLDEPLNLVVNSGPGDLSFTWDRHALTASDAWSLKMERGEARTEGLRLVGEATDLSLSASRSEGGSALIAGGGRFDLGLIELFTGETLRAEGVGELRLALNRVGERFDGALDVTVEEATLRTDAFPHPFERVEAHIVGRPSGYVVLTGQGEVGGGGVTLGGSVEARDWVPVRYDLTANLIDARVRYFDFLPPMVADADLALGGPTGRPLALRRHPHSGHGLLRAGGLGAVGRRLPRAAALGPRRRGRRRRRLLRPRPHRERGRHRPSAQQHRRWPARREPARHRQHGAARHGRRGADVERWAHVPRGPRVRRHPGRAALCRSLDLGSRARLCSRDRHLLPRPQLPRHLPRERPLLRLARRPPLRPAFGPVRHQRAHPLRRHPRGDRARGRRRRLGHRHGGPRSVVDRREPARLGASRRRRAPGHPRRAGHRRVRPRLLGQLRVAGARREADQPARRRHAHRRVQPLPTQRPVPRRREAARPQRLLQRVLGELSA
jgi:hypothetical protein